MDFELIHIVPNYNYKLYLKPGFQIIVATVAERNSYVTGSELIETVALATGTTLATVAFAVARIAYVLSRRLDRSEFSDFYHSVGVS